MEVFVLTERKKGIVKTVFGWLFLALAFASFILTLMGALLLFLPGVLFAVIWYCFFLKANKEFECSYFDGELRFARIINKSRRKRIGIYNIEEVVTIAPAGDRSVYNYENDRSAKIKDYTSGEKNVPYYDIIVRNQDGTTIIKAELDDKYLDEVSKKYRSKVVRKQA